jgi:hypothetical protein
LNARFRFETANVAVSDRWLAWEEVGPGDDLAMHVPWRLYAAEIDSASLSIGKPFLVVSGQTQAMSRPLIDLEGDRLAWMVNVHSRGGDTSPRGELRVVDLRRGVSLLARRAGPAQVFRTISLQGELVWASAEGPDLPHGPRLTVFRLGKTAPDLSLDLDQRFGTNHWPAVRDGYVAWSAFSSPDQSLPTLYLRTPNGEVQTIADGASEPTFVGRYVFYERDTPGTQLQPGETSEIWAYDPSSRRRRPVVLAKLEDDGQWLLGVNKSLNRHTLLAWGDMWSATTYERSYVKIRVYRILR